MHPLFASTSPFPKIPESSQRSLLIRVNFNLGAIAEVGWRAPQDGDRAPDLYVGCDAVVVVEQRLGGNRGEEG